MPKVKTRIGKRSSPFRRGGGTVVLERDKKAWGEETRAKRELKEPRGLGKVRRSEVKSSTRVKRKTGGGEKVSQRELQMVWGS